MKLKINSLVFLLILIMITLSSYAYFEDLKNENFCIVGNGCSEVRSSEYSTIFGIKVSLFGTISSLILLMAHLIKKKNKITGKLFQIIVYVGAIFAVYFIYIQLFVLKAVCQTCILIDSLMILIAGLIFLIYKRR